MLCINKSDAALILLTYKGKILLMLQNSSPLVIKDKLWCFIGGSKQKNKSVEASISKLVEKETSIKLPSVEFLSTGLIDEQTSYFYHANLTDENVNNIKRDNDKIFNFFSFREITKLTLTPATKLFVSKHKDILEASHSN